MIVTHQIYFLLSLKLHAQTIIASLANRLPLVYDKGRVF